MVFIELNVRLNLGKVRLQLNWIWVKFGLDYSLGCFTLLLNFNLLGTWLPNFNLYRARE